MAKSMSLYLGFDVSTQSTKAEIIDATSGQVCASETINYGKELPSFHSPNGYLDLPQEDTLVCHSDPLMWAAALELVLQRLQAKKVPLHSVVGISGSAQQHGSVYLNASFNTILGHLSAESTLAEQLKPTLARKTSPIWMDRSTNAECQELNAKFGHKLQATTGSPAVERFTAAQIRRFWKQDAVGYNATAHVHLVSSFMASLLCGHSVPIDFGDGSGMNLLNLSTLAWDSEIVDFVAPHLGAKLPPIVPSTQIVGHLSSYFSKYGLKPGIPIVAWSGDNPSSLAGTGAAEAGFAVISLGTSDTLFTAMQDFKTDPAGYGHVFGNPAGGFMSLTCFTNGSLARERVRAGCLTAAGASLSWAELDTQVLTHSSPGNNRNLMLPYFTAESVPLILKPGILLKGDSEFIAGRASNATKMRALLESQALSMRLHSQWIAERFLRLRVTGGGSESRALCRILADVFQTDVERISVSASAALGAALKAAHVVAHLPWPQLFQKFIVPIETVHPNPAAASVYQTALQDYAALEASSSSA